MSFVNENRAGIYLIAGLLLGCWIGYKVLPSIEFFRPPPPAPVEETAGARDVREKLEQSLAMTLLQSENIVAASVHLTDGGASATLTFSDDGVTPGQVETIAGQIASSADGLHAGRVLLYDSKGTQLNLEAVQAFEKREFWTRIAINVAKILGILAAFITLRYVIQCIGRGSCAKSADEA